MEKSKDKERGGGGRDEGRRKERRGCPKENEPFGLRGCLCCRFLFLRLLVVWFFS